MTTKLTKTVAFCALAFAAASPAIAQTGQNGIAPVRGAMTMDQARAACQTEMQAQRTAQAGAQAAMQTCVDQKMRGTGSQSTNK
jgi:hypothetical protein